MSATYQGMTRNNLNHSMADIEAFFQQIRDLLDSGKTFAEATGDFDGLVARAAVLDIGGFPREFLRQCHQQHRFVV